MSPTKLTIRPALCRPLALVAADEVEQLGQAFRRGGRARVGDGHGLGLAIAQEVTRAHRGRTVGASSHLRERGRTHA